jgi:UPF0176 protein
MEPKSLTISSFYAFDATQAPTLQAAAQKLLDLGQRLRLSGLVLMGPEGVNSTVAGAPLAVDEFESLVARLWPQSPVHFKRSQSRHRPFRKLKVKIKPEIVTMGQPGQVPTDRARHLSPSEWHEALKDPATIVLDTRNVYETAIGTFEGAIDPKLNEFREWSAFLQNSDLPRDKRILIFCTGGIRCEKAILEMDRQGFQDVRQLDGGILAYLKEYPRQKFKGDCFVFDQRVAVDQDLQPCDQYSLCPHCGQPAPLNIVCVQCRVAARVCASCLDLQGDRRATCSKNCAHHLRHGHRSTRIHWDGLHKLRAEQPSKLPREETSVDGGK